MIVVVAIARPAPPVGISDVSILGDHRRFKKRFIPPLLASGMDFKFSNWVRGTVPEVFWIGVLLRTLGYGDGVAAALAIAKEAQDHVSDDAGLPAFAFARAYLAPTDTQISEIAERARVVADARRGLKELEPLFRVYPDYPSRGCRRLGRPPCLQLMTSGFSAKSWKACWTVDRATRRGCNLRPSTSQPSRDVSSGPSKELPSRSGADQGLPGYRRGACRCRRSPHDDAGADRHGRDERRVRAT